MSATWDTAKIRPKPAIAAAEALWPPITRRRGAGPRSGSCFVVVALPGSAIIGASRGTGSASLQRSITLGMFFLQIGQVCRVCLTRGHRKGHHGRRRRGLRPTARHGDRPTRTSKTTERRHAGLSERDLVLWRGPLLLWRVVSIVWPSSTWRTLSGSGGVGG
jgi:hypothetical protein